MCREEQPRLTLQRWLCPDAVSQERPAKEMSATRCVLRAGTSSGVKRRVDVVAGPREPGKPWAWWVLSVSFPHISLRIFLALSSDYIDLTCPSSVNISGRF